MTVDRPATPLTRRETELVQAMDRGLSCRQIARELGISELTVRKHRCNLMAKLGVHSAAGVVALARRSERWRACRGPPP